MAEFQEIIKQWKRKCEYCDKSKNVECSINGYVCDGFCKMREYIYPEFIERDVVSWAAKHPEPVYPTWGDWLAEKGELCKNWKDIRVISTADNSASGVIGWFYKSIPADMAQKLGIEPKEGA